MPTQCICWYNSLNFLQTSFTFMNWNYYRHLYPPIGLSLWCRSGFEPLSCAYWLSFPNCHTSVLKCNSFRPSAPFFITSPFWNPSLHNPKYILKPFFVFFPKNPILIRVFVFFDNRDVAPLMIPPHLVIFRSNLTKQVLFPTFESLLCWLEIKFT
jgi:hypothetical protein